MSGWRVIDGRPCPVGVAPYVFIVLRDAEHIASAIYRGDDPVAKRILHAHGAHTQRELVNATPAERAAWGIEGTPNPVHHSEHELYSDGVANPHVPAGHRIKPWQVGIDSRPADGSDADAEKAKASIEAAARRHGWHVRHPYTAGIEGHHWCFGEEPRPHSARMRLRVAHLRLTLPRR